MNVFNNNECHKRLEPQKVDEKINLKLKLSKSFHDVLQGT